MRQLPFKYKKKVLQTKAIPIHPSKSLPDFSPNRNYWESEDWRCTTNTLWRASVQLIDLSDKNKYTPRRPNSTWEYQHKHNIQYIKKSFHNKRSKCVTNLDKTSRDTCPFERALIVVLKYQTQCSNGLRLLEISLNYCLFSTSKYCMYIKRLMVESIFLYHAVNGHIQLFSSMTSRSPWQNTFLVTGQEISRRGEENVSGVLLP